MERIRIGIGPILALAALLGPAAGADDNDGGPIDLDERSRPGAQARIVATLEADGRYLSGDGADGSQTEPIAVTVRTRLEGIDRVLAVDGDGRARRVVRRVDRGEVAIDRREPIRPETTVIRPEAGLLVVELTDGDGDAVAAGLRGPLTRLELELVQGPAEPLELPAALPDRPVAVGDRWPLPDAAARALSGYDTIASNTLEAELTRADEGEAEVALSGRVAGAVLGASGSIELEGTLRFDRRAERVAMLRLERSERREAGPVEAGLEFRSTLSVDRSEVDGPLDPPLPDPPARPPRDALLLVYTDPSGRYRLEHDRSWHVISEDDRQSTLRRLDVGEVVAQCDIVAGPTLEPGSKPEPERFRDDVREALGERFDRFLDIGRLRVPTGEAHLRLAALGHRGDVPIVWYYYLMSEPAGRQFVAIFTLRRSEAERFGRRDQRMIGSLRWLDGPDDAEGPGR